MSPQSAINTRFQLDRFDHLSKVCTPNLNDYAVRVVHRATDLFSNTGWLSIRWLAGWLAIQLAPACSPAVTKGRSLTLQCREGMPTVVQPR